MKKTITEILDFLLLVSILFLTVFILSAKVSAQPNIDPYQRTQYGSPGSSNNPIYQAYGNPVTWAAGSINSNIVSVQGTPVSSINPIPEGNTANAWAPNPAGTMVPVLNTAVIGGPAAGIPVYISGSATTSGINVTITAWPNAYMSTSITAYPSAYSGTSITAWPNAYMGTSITAYPSAYSGTSITAWPNAYLGTSITAYPSAYSGTSITAWPNAYMGTSITAFPSYVTVTGIDITLNKIYSGVMYTYQDVTANTASTGHFYCMYAGSDTTGMDANFVVSSYAGVKWYLYEMGTGSFTPGMTPVTITVSNINRISSNTTNFAAYANYVTPTTGILLDSCFTNANLPGTLGMIASNMRTDTIFKAGKSYYVEAIPDAANTTINIRGWAYDH